MEEEILPPRPFPWGSFVAAVLGFLTLLAVLAADWHVVSTAQGPRFVRKVCWSFSETFVSAEAISGMPYLAAKVRYPLAVQALQRDGILESEEAFQARVQADVDKQMEKIRLETEKQVEETRRLLGY